ncbi:MAG TPA: PilZ domain-containing protein [Candidatus Acidoferrum sp.]|nr:PilZ domain-containing protein [Candidatus Acidoferrum sp.]
MAQDFARKQPDAGARFAERRSAPRFPMVADADIVEPITRTHLSGRTAEVSVGGCYVDVQNPLPAGTVIQICIQRETGSFATWGRIAYAQQGIGMGIAFFNTVPEQAVILREWIAGLSA